MAVDLGRGVDMTPYYYSAEALNLFLICLLLAFHIFRTGHQSKSKSKNKSPKLCGILTLRTVSCIMLSFYIIRGTLVLITFITNKKYTYLDAYSCYILMVINNSLIQFARYSLHLFLAIRSRLSSLNATYSIWSKIGFVLMTSDLSLVIATWAIPAWIMMDISEDGTQCITVGFGLANIIWVIVNDVIVSTYTLCVFILPLRKVITLEKQAQNIEMNIQSNTTQSSGQSSTQNVTVNCNNSKPIDNKNEKSIAGFVRRITWCSAGALSTTAIACAIALTVGILQGITSPLLMFIRCYLVIMQFADIDINEIDAHSNWRALIILFQWDQWKCNLCKFVKIKKQTTIKEAKSIASSSTNISSNISSAKSVDSL